jgi:hypothetical protein
MGLLFDAGTIAEFTRISESEMPDLVTVTTYTLVDGEMGGRVRSDPETVTTKGRVERFGQISQHVLMLSIPLGIEVQSESTVTVISERVGYSGVYVVEPADSGSYAVHQQFLLTPANAA